MDYTSRFKSTMSAALKGYIAGALISVIILILGGITNVLQFIAMFITFTIFIGSIVAIIICAKTGVQGYLSGALAKIWNGIIAAFLGHCFWGIHFLYRL